MTTGTTPAADTRKEAVGSDLGTILMHWTLTIATILSLITGLRLSADAENSRFAILLDPILWVGELWTWHYLSAVAVLGLIFGYPIYMAKARLKRRISSKRTTVLSMPEASRKLKVAALNVIGYWILFAAVLTLTATGILLYMGKGGILVDIHYISALVVFAYIFIHVVLHYMYGGLAQLLRLFRPRALREFAGMTKFPVFKAIAAGAVAAGAIVFVDFSTRGELIVKNVKELPVLDGDLSDDVWAGAKSVVVETHQGVGLNGTGDSDVEIKALRSGDKIVFAFKWEDPSRSLKRHPLIKKEDGWYMLNNRADTSDETAYYEDKFSVAFAKTDAFGGGGSTYMGKKPLKDKPASLHGRGYHYTTDGSLIDVWQWKASRGGMIGKTDDMWFGTPVEPNEAQIAGKKRYSAGYGADEGKSFYVYNYKKKPDSSYRGTVGVRRLPIDYKATVAKMGNIDLDINATDDAGSQWWMYEHETVEYSEEVDAGIPVGTMLPGVLIQGEYQGSRADLNSGAKWKDGYWTLEIVRDIDTGNKQDLKMEDGLFVYVSVFDHNQIRHTRHSRPVRLVLN